MSERQNNIDKLLGIMALLRDPDKGCPWDVEQTFETIAPHTIEEAYEVAEAIEQGDMDALVDELGDLLLQVVFHARMAEEAGHFNFEDVAGAISDKLIRRHPHVFEDKEIKTAEAQTAAWEDQKANERKSKVEEGTMHSAMDGVTTGLPALTRALKLQKRAARVGFDWSDPSQVLDKFSEEISELAHEMKHEAPEERLKDELGDVLFTCVNMARKLDIDPETALRHGNAKFEKRFRVMEELIDYDNDRLKAADIDELMSLWDQAKKKC